MRVLNVRDSFSYTRVAQIYFFDSYYYYAFILAKIYQPRDAWMM